MLDVLNKQLARYFAEATFYLFYILNIAVILVVISTLFAVIFKILPDATIRWKDAFVGALFTSVLFLIGKFAIGFYLGQANLGLTYGAAASIVVILSWVYYSSLILFFGAEFTKVYALSKGGGIKVASTAVFIVKSEVREMADARHPEDANGNQVA